MGLSPSSSALGEVSQEAIVHSVATAGRSRRTIAARPSIGRLPLNWNSGYPTRPERIVRRSSPLLEETACGLTPNILATDAPVRAGPSWSTHAWASASAARISSTIARAVGVACWYRTSTDGMAPPPTTAYQGPGPTDTWVHVI